VPRLVLLKVAIALVVLVLEAQPRRVFEIVVIVAVPVVGLGGLPLVVVAHGVSLGGRRAASSMRFLASSVGVVNE
jgi:hypothetical protein